MNRSSENIQSSIFRDFFLGVEDAITDAMFLHPPSQTFRNVANVALGGLAQRLCVNRSHFGKQWGAACGGWQAEENDGFERPETEETKAIQVILIETEKLLQEFDRDGRGSVRDLQALARGVEMLRFDFGRYISALEDVGADQLVEEWNPCENLDALKQGLSFEQRVEISRFAATIQANIDRDLETSERELSQRQIREEKERESHPVPVDPCGAVS